MTAIVAVNFDWSIESCDKAPRDLDYEPNTEKYGRAMKLTIATLYVCGYRNKDFTFVSTAKVGQIY